MNWKWSKLKIDINKLKISIFDREIEINQLKKYSNIYCQQFIAKKSTKGRIHESYLIIQLTNSLIILLSRI